MNISNTNSSINFSGISCQRVQTSIFNILDPFEKTQSRSLFISIFLSYQKSFEMRTLTLFIWGDNALGVSKRIVVMSHSKQVGGRISSSTDLHFVKKEKISLRHRYSPRNKCILSVWSSNKVGLVSRKTLSC